ncbi:MAG: hypothetical protein IT176_15170 [Acidobacteria bacterium]|nr:hypothetical protein [Acidobacteriota bacterium]
MPQPQANPDPRALNGVAGVYTALGRMGTLTPSYDPVRGELNFSFSTDPDGHLAMGTAGNDGVMQFSIVALGERPSVLLSQRMELNGDGSEKHVDAASQAQLRELTRRFNDARGILTTLVITVDERRVLAYEFLTGAQERTAGSIDPER